MLYQSRFTHPEKMFFHSFHHAKESKIQLQTQSGSLSVRLGLMDGCSFRSVPFMKDHVSLDANVKLLGKLSNFSFKSNKPHACAAKGSKHFPFVFGVLNRLSAPFFSHSSHTSGSSLCFAVSFLRSFSAALSKDCG